MEKYINRYEAARRALELLKVHPNGCPEVNGYVAGVMCIHNIPGVPNKPLETVIIDVERRGRVLWMRNIHRVWFKVERGDKFYIWEA